MKKIIIYTDGGARNNPGPAGIGIVIYDETGKILETHKEFIGEATNNVAEYTALITALKRAKKYNPEEIECRLDSELVVKQTRGEYKTKDPKMRELLEEVRQLVFFKPITFSHIPRAKNVLADKLVNEAIDESLSL
jgi:ribonuclease HI